MNSSPEEQDSHGSVIARLGIFPPLAWGYFGLLLFMIGDGVEYGFLSPFLTERGVPNVAWIVTVYGITVAISAWLSGALSDLWGPRRVMLIGLLMWAVCHAAFLLLGVARASYGWSLVTFALRGFGYPLFAYGFLVWITAVTPRRQLGTAVGWFWFAFTGGLPTLGSLLARYTIPLVGHYNTLWISLGFVVAGGMIALLCVREPIGRRRLAPPGEHPVATVISSVSIAWRRPKTAIGCIVRVINTAPQNGFWVFLPVYFEEILGYSESQWLEIVSWMFLSNIIWNLLFGVIGDRLGWRQTVAVCGGVGSAITTLLLYYAPALSDANYAIAVFAAIAYGATLAGYVPLSALMPSLAPEHKGAAMSLLNLGAGASAWVGPAIVALFLKPLGVAGVMWIYAGLYLLSAVLTLFLTLPDEAPEQTAAAEGEFVPA
jgi:polyol permease family